MHSPTLGKSRTKGTSRGPDLNTSGSGSPWVLICWEKGQERSREVPGVGVGVMAHLLSCGPLVLASAQA